MKKTNLLRTIILAGSLLLQLNTLCFHSRGAAGDVDLSFDPGSGVNGGVSAVAVQPDGKVIIGGNFTTVKGLARTNVARLNADGSGDPTFNSGIAYTAVSSLALQSDGKVLVGGGFVHYECDDSGCYDRSAVGVTRLNSNGSQDTNFPSSAFYYYYSATVIASIAVQPDGKVLIGGKLTAVGYGIARLNANGSLDASFNPGTGAMGYPGGVNSIVVQPDGKVLIGGGFTMVNGTNRSGLARLNANGSLDTSFNPGTGANQSVSSVALQSDGKVLIGGNFSAVNGTNRNSIARLNANGSLDGSFNPGTGAGGSTSGYGVTSVVVQSDGKVLIGGDFTTVNGTNRIGLARLNANGSLDNSFNSGASSLVYSVVVQADGKVLIAANRIARLNADGSADSSFNPGSGVVSYFTSLAAQPDGKVLVGTGTLFAFINGTNRYGSARRNVDGSWDTTFISDSFNPDMAAPGPQDYAQPSAFGVQPDGKVLVGGFYYALFNCDESGCLTFYSYSVTRVNANGSRDTSFEPVAQNSPYGYVESVGALAVQPNGKVVVGGLFYSIKGASRYGIARLNANGSLDGSFFSPLSFGSRVSSVVVQPDGKLIIAGDFPSLDGQSRSQIARLNDNGSWDASFNPVTMTGYPYPPYPEIQSVAMQPNGKVLIGGDFTAVNGTNRNGIARLNADGSLDLSFNPGAGANGRVYAIALQPDGKVLIGGDFTTVNGVVRPYVARLYGDSFPPALNIARSSASVILSWPVTGLNFQLQESTNLSLPNSWSPVAQTTVTNAGQISVTVPTTVGRKFFRLKSQ